MNSRSKHQIGVGIIGGGKISQAYFNGAKAFDVLDIVACADLNAAVAQAKAEEKGCQALSIDVVAADHSPIQLYGTEGSIKVPDPNTFDGPVFSFVRGNKEWTEHPLTRPYADNTRGIGVADMAQAILTGRPHRASGTLAMHVLEVMHAFDQSSETGTAIKIQSQPERPAALPETRLDSV